MSVKPIVVEPAQIHIHADRRLAFQVLTAFDVVTPGEQAAPAPRILQDEGDRKLVAFSTPIKMLGMTKVFPTTEWVSMQEPEQIDFSMVPGKGVIVGGLKLLQDRFTLEDRSGCTLLRYDSTFGIRWSWPGWILGKLLFERVMRSTMNHHLKEVKVMIEERAKRSRMFPQVENCPEG
jgi:hypothetical protein